MAVDGNATMEPLGCDPVEGKERYGFNPMSHRHSSSRWEGILREY